MAWEGSCPPGPLKNEDDLLKQKGCKMKRYDGKLIKVKAFTLIELLVVIAIIALLMAIIIPGLNMAKKKAASAACLSNLRQMSIAWYMYQEENDGRIMSCRMEDVGTTISCKEGWIGQPHTATDTTSSSLSMTQTTPVTDEDEIRGIVKGKLYEYLESTDVYHCPADKLRKGCDGTRIFNSYAVPYCLNNGSSSSIKKFGNITSPGTRFNFTEAGTYGCRNWQWGGWWSFSLPDTGDPALHDPVAISHGNSAVFGFVDGHAEVHKWHDSVVLDHYYKGETMKPGDMYGLTSRPCDDIDWISRGWADRP